MRTYILKRLLYAIPTIFGITVLIFGIMRILPGDPLGAYYGIETIIQWTPEQKAAILRDLGLDKPIAVQYAVWVKDIASGKLGESFFRGDPIIEIMAQRGPISAQIGIISVVISWIIGLPVGIISAVRPNSVWDMCTSFFTVLFLAIPGFWLGLLVVVASISWFQYKAPIVSVQFWEDPWTNFQIIVGPAIVLGLGQAAFIARMARSSLFEVLREDYVRTSRAKGLIERLVIARHAMPNALLPVLTLSGVLLGFVMGGSVAVEQAFTVPGLGKALVVAAIDRDFNVVQNIVLFYAVIFVLVNLLIDMLYGWLDPRIRLN
ncbi:MAG: ABC transporter permease [Chloroflexota bacterium]|nr:ABC transporter permease [Chloroflexota bacterium]MCY3638445.1 ABC transporter permease [Chloroflexota bacterium]MDE2686935.1 ABC transporter permease [Chloroflexota bacterium]